MIRHLVIGCIIVFWVTMMALLVKREVLPAWVSGGPAYRQAPAPEEPPRRTQMGIYWGGRRLGTCRNVTRRDTDGVLLINGNVELEAEVPFLRFRTRLDVTSHVRAAPDGRLLSFRIDAVAPGFARTISGEVAGGDLVVTSTVGGQASTWTVPFDPRDAVAHDLAAMEGLGDLRVGQRWHVQNINPISGEYSIVPVEVERQERLSWRGETVETFLVVSRVSGMECRAWVRPGGEVLRQELPLGMVMELEPWGEPAACSRPHAGPGRS